MNWLDIILVGILAAGGPFGMWTGMVRASFTVLGVAAGFIVVGHYRDDTAGWLAGFMSNAAVIDLLSYAITIFAAVAVTMVAAGLVRKLVYGMFMGWADRLAGMTAGLAVGAALALAMVIGLAGLSYGGPGGFLETRVESGLPGRVLALTPYEAGDLSGLETKLTESTLVPVMVNAADVVPADARGLLPPGWLDTLERLERNLDGLRTARR
ncbi:MAG: CvpA family protein [Chloroflexi bacterium]|nr:CvpA family protein [Chloroflexota bacterium]MDA1270284.1 CvpA family protein [Chloroflexota bacterium]PKB59435.1 MAG: hypothetical protein BZY83_01920 [SAR202 cluster bacterium Casp-Chloro-G2]